MGVACSTFGGGGFDGEITRKEAIWKNWEQWEDNIEMGVKVMGYEGVPSVHLVQNRNKWMAVVNTVMSFRVS